MTVNQYSPSQLGVRPAPALVQQLLIGAFGWMFVGLLLSAGVAYLVGTNLTLLETVSQWWLPLMIALNEPARPPISPLNA